MWPAKPSAAEIEVGQETEHDTHWVYEVRVFADGKARRHRVTLSFQDYDHWSHGRVPPSRVVAACLRYLLNHEPADQVQDAFDCSVIRRKFPEVDRELPATI